MTTLLIYQDSKGAGTCRACGAPIVWAELTSGKRHPFNAPLTVAGIQPGMFDERTVERVENREQTSHFATCPQASAFRREKTS
jgi:hypothetical protein